jgi:hypothetical protein
MASITAPILRLVFIWFPRFFQWFLFGLALSSAIIVDVTELIANFVGIFGFDNVF